MNEQTASVCALYAFKFLDMQDFFSAAIVFVCGVKGTNVNKVSLELSKCFPDYAQFCTLTFLT